MTIALWLLALQGCIGAFDTIYYHELRAKLVARVPGTRRELMLHAVRDFIYAFIFAALPWWSFRGGWVAVIGVALGIEICLTMADFVEERRSRQALGDVFAGERVTHAAMGILYGAMLACALPELARWGAMEAAVAWDPAPVPAALRLALSVMAAGVLASGLRDLYAALGLPGGSWPWAGGEGQ